MATEPVQATYKRIILCCDGTWLAANTGDDSEPSNVAKLARAIAPTGLDAEGKIVKQIVLYHSGLGSTSLPAAKAIEGGIGWGLDVDVTQIYDFITNNFEIGDELFFFGFSRGAFTVRSAAGLISNAGILSAVNMSHFHEMWSAYRRRTGSFQETQWYRENSEKLKLTAPPIQIVGVWETVGALGVPEWPGVKALRHLGVNLNQEYAFHDTGLSNNISHAFQALALDEKRITFPPTIWHKSSDTQHLEQCWFPGVHANIGGQAEYPMFFSDRSELAANTFAWMVDNIGTKLTFEDSTLAIIVSEHTDALLQNGIPDGWGCGKIIDNFAGLQGAFFRLLGQQKRTPGGYTDMPGATNEFMHPIARYRRDQVSSWKPPSLDGFHIEGPGNNDSRRIRWTKIGQNPMAEYVMSPEKILSVSILEDGIWTFKTRASLARQLCPASVLQRLDSESGVIINGHI